MFEYFRPRHRSGFAEQRKGFRSSFDGFWFDTLWPIADLLLTDQGEQQREALLSGCTARRSTSTFRSWAGPSGARAPTKCRRFSMPSWHVTASCARTRDAEGKADYLFVC
jgi:hypothetical protein